MILVDSTSYSFGRMRMCHMVSTTSVEELHAFAASLGLKRSWFQFLPNRRYAMPHYDISMSKRRLALGLGAVPVPARALAERAYRPDGPPPYLKDST